MGAVFFNDNFSCFPNKPSPICIHIPKRTSRVPADFHNRNICKSARDCVAQPQKNIVAIVPHALLHYYPEVLNVVQLVVKFWVKNGQVASFWKQLLQHATLGFEVWLTCHNTVTHSQVPGWTHLRVHQSVVAESWDSEGAPGFQL
jgi:hypothetical protein